MNQEVLRELLKAIKSCEGVESTHTHELCPHAIDHILKFISEHTAVVERNARIDELNLLPLVWGDDTRKNQNEYLVGRFQELQEALSSKEWRR